jgi:RNA polymerase-interacting CarD/CdnL/TRCF family regulator
VLENIKTSSDNNRESCIERILHENAITEEVLWERLRDEVDDKLEENESNNREVYSSLYREIENRNLMENKRESIKEFMRGIYYDKFF